MRQGEERCLWVLLCYCNTSIIVFLTDTKQHDILLNIVYVNNTAIAETLKNSETCYSHKSVYSVKRTITRGPPKPHPCHISCGPITHASLLQPCHHQGLIQQTGLSDINYFKPTNSYQHLHCNRSTKKGVSELICFICTTSNESTYNQLKD